MATIVEVAKRARVSIGTVSNVLRGTAPVSAELRERVGKVIRELDYHPNEIARSLKVNQTYMLGMVLPDITNPFFPEIIRGAEDQAFVRGYLLVTANTDEQIERERRIIAMLRSRRVDGILLASAPAVDTSHIKGAIKGGTPIVCLDRTVPELRLIVSYLITSAEQKNVCATWCGQAIRTLQSSLARCSCKLLGNAYGAMKMRWLSPES